MKLRAIATTLALAVLVSACGLKGPLYLPEKAGPVTTRPGPAAPAPAAEAPAAEPPPPSDGTSDKTGG